MSRAAYHVERTLKQREQFRLRYADRTVSELFSSLVFWIDGRTHPSAAELRDLIGTHGGVVENQYHPNVTHVIAEHLPDGKVKQLLESGGGFLRRDVVLLKPNWILDCVQNSRLLPTGPYLLVRQGPALFSQPSASKSTSSQKETPVEVESIPVVQNAVPEVAETTTTPQSTAWTESLQQACSISFRTTRSTSTASNPAVAGSSSSVAASFNALAAAPMTRPRFDNPHTINMSDNVIELNNPISVSSIFSAPSYIPTHSASDHSTKQPSHPIIPVDLVETPECSSITVASPIQSSSVPQPLPEDVPVQIQISEATAVNNAKPVDSEPAGISIEHQDMSPRKPRFSGLPSAWQSILHHKPVHDEAEPHEHDFDGDDGPPETELKGARSSLENPTFVKDYFAKSRLHFIGSWQAFVDTLPSFVTGVPKYQAPANVHQPRVIVHIDMDCFFASVSMRMRPDIAADTPVVVCHSVSQSVASTSEIAAANYAARAFGIRAGTRLGKARSLCPQLVSLPYQFEAYTQTSRNLYACLFGFTHSVEILSCDEALLEFDATQFQSSKERVTELCQELRDAVKAATGCNASTGAAGSVLLARMATQRAKPNGLFVLPIMSLTPSQSSMEDVDQNSPVAVITRFVQSCSLDDLPGVGWSNSHSLAAEPYLIKSIDDVLRTPLASLQTAMSSETAGTKLYWAARGREWPQPRPLSVHKQRKSVSAEITWGVRFNHDDQVRSFLRDLAEEVAKKLGATRRRASQITFKLMRTKGQHLIPWKHLGHGPCTSHTASRKLLTPTPPLTIDTQHDGPMDAQTQVALNAVVDVVFNSVLPLCMQMKIPPDEIRGLGITLGSFTESSDTSKSVADMLVSKALSTAKAVKKSQLSSSKKDPVALQLQMSRLVMSDLISVTEILPNPHLAAVQYDSPPRTMRDTETSSVPVPAKSTQISSVLPPPPFRNAPGWVDAVPLSQLDRATIDELPDDVKSALKADYQRILLSRPGAPPKSVDTGNKKLSSKAKTAPKQTAVAQRTLPFIRPSDASTPSPKRQKVAASVANESAAEVISLLDDSMERQPVADHLNESALNHQRSDVEVIEPVARTESNTFRVFQLESVDDILDQIRLWIAAIPDPNESHSKLLTAFFMEKLRCDSDLCAVQRLLTGTRRLIGDRFRWHVALDRVIDQVQLHFNERYGARLSL